MPRPGFQPNTRSTVSTVAHLFPVTSPVIFKTDGDQTITLTDSKDPTITGDTMVHVFAPGTAVFFLVTSPANAMAGTGFLVVQALDVFGGIATGYLGTVRFGTTDTNPMIKLPGNYKFAPGDNGVHDFTGVILDTAGVQAIGVRDMVEPAITGSRQLLDLPAATARLLVVPAAPYVVPNVAPA